jgi:hypothetical protein
MQIKHFTHNQLIEVRVEATAHAWLTIPAAEMECQTRPGRASGWRSWSRSSGKRRRGEQQKKKAERRKKTKKKEAREAQRERGLGLPARKQKEEKRVAEPERKDPNLA